MTSLNTDDGSKGFSVWIFIVVLTALAIIGLLVVVFVGSPTDDSKPIVTPTTTPSSVPDTTTVDGGSTSSTTVATPPVTMPGGGVAPEGATSIEVDGGVLTVRFAIDTSGFGSKAFAKVPPIDVVSGKTLSGVVVSIGCSSSSREQLSQVTLTETEEAVRIGAVVLIPTNATGCNPSLGPRRMMLPLDSQLGNREVQVESEDLELPLVDVDSLGG